MTFNQKLSLNQKLLLFLPRIDSFWADLAGRATVFIMVIFSAIHSHVIQFFGVKEWLFMGLSSAIFSAVFAAIFVLFSGKLNQAEAAQSFKLRRLVLPKRAYSLKMWASNTPYTALFILIVILWLAFYGWYFGQSSPSSEDIAIACLSMVFLGSLYVFCVLAQGYRDFFNDETVLEELAKHHATASPWIGADFWPSFLVLLIPIFMLAVLMLSGEFIVSIRGYWF